MPSNNTPKKTLKQEKLWLIDAEKGEITYDVSNDVNDGWWNRIGQSYGSQRSQVTVQKGEFERISPTTGIQWLDHHSQAYNDTNRHHPQRGDVDRNPDDVKIKS